MDLGRLVLGFPMLYLKGMRIAMFQLCRPNENIESEGW